MTCFINTIQWQQKGVVSECSFTYSQAENEFPIVGVCTGERDGSEANFWNQGNWFRGALSYHEKGNQFASLNFKRRRGGFCKKSNLCFVRDNFKATIILHYPSCPGSPLVSNYHSGFKNTRIFLLVIRNGLIIMENWYTLHVPGGLLKARQDSTWGLLTAWRILSAVPQEEDLSLLGLTVLD